MAKPHATGKVIKFQINPEVHGNKAKPDWMYCYARIKFEDLNDVQDVRYHAWRHKESPIKEGAQVVVWRNEDRFNPGTFHLDYGGYPKEKYANNTSTGRTPTGVTSNPAATGSGGYQKSPDIQKQIQRNVFFKAAVELAAVASKQGLPLTSLLPDLVLCLQAADDMMVLKETGEVSDLLTGNVPVNSADDQIDPFTDDPAYPFEAGVDKEGHPADPFASFGGGNEVPF